MTKTHDDLLTSGVTSGECRLCGMQFAWMDQDEYESKVARHIWENHRDEPIDKPIVIQE